MKRIDQMMTEKGAPVVMAALTKAVNKSDRTVRRWFKKGVPTSHDAYLLALACGCSEQEALALASLGPKVTRQK
jgi:hypothetical protein